MIKIADTGQPAQPTARPPVTPALVKSIDRVEPVDVKQADVKQATTLNSAHRLLNRLPGLTTDPLLNRLDAADEQVDHPLEP
jgi:hypothetical protein